MNRPSRALSIAHTFLRGVSSRWLLSLGSVVLCTLALAAAVLGPAFSVAVTDSYVVSRLEGVDLPSTGLSWEFRPSEDRRWTPRAAVAAAEELTRDRVPAAFGAPTSQLESVRQLVPLPIWSQAMLLARSGACEHLVLDGRCPRRAGEVILLRGDAAEEHKTIGDLVDYGPFGKLRIVGTYALPASAGPGSAAADFWFSLSRFDSQPWHLDGGGNTVPAITAPFITVPATFDHVPVTSWVVRLDSRLDVTPAMTVQLLSAVASSPGLVRAQQPVSSEAGALDDSSTNDLPALSRELVAQQATARASITPAVSSVVLVALALLTRLLLAAGELRVAELALGSLRGMSARRLWTVGLVEPLSLIAVSVPLGLVLGAMGTKVLARAWLVPGLPTGVPTTSWLALVLVGVAAVAVAALTVALVLRRSLASQLSGVRRPVAMRRASLVAVLALVALAAAALVSTASGRSSSPDATDALLPVLLACVAGLGATRLVGLSAREVVRRRRVRSLASLVALRSLAGRHEGTLVIVPLCIALAVGVFGAGVYTSASAWRESVASTEAPADSVWSTSGLVDMALNPVDLPMSTVVELTRDLDPHGRWLMAGAVLTTTDSDYTVLDTPRLARVARWPGSWTPGHDAGEVARTLGAGPVPRLRGHRVAVTLTVPEGSGPATLQLDYRRPRGLLRRSYLGPYPPGTTTRATTVSCAGGCELQGLAVGGPAATPMPMSGTYDVSRVAVDGRAREDLVENGGWVASPGDVSNQVLQHLRVQDGRLSIDVGPSERTGVAYLTTAEIPRERPVLVGPDVKDLGARGGFGAAVSDTGGHPPVRAAMTTASIPFLGTDGVLIDYTMMTHDRVVFDNSWHTYVLARSDTPSRLVDDLAARGLHVETRHANVKARLDATPYALAMRLYGLAALLSLLLALAGLAVSTAVQLPGRRMDAASLRVVGVPVRTLVGALVRELGAALGAAAVAGLSMGWLAQWCVLRTITLGTVDAHDVPRPVAAIDVSSGVVAALVAAAGIAVVATASALLTVRGARGHTLRERAR